MALKHKAHWLENGRIRRTPEYTAWSHIIQRCTNPNENSYSYYGGRGIKVCNRWRESYDNFIEDMGYRPTADHSLDRIDFNGNYEPSNCRWATRRIQARNTRKRADNKIGHTSIAKQGNKFVARIQIGGFDTIDQAIYAREQLINLAKDYV